MARGYSIHFGINKYAKHGNLNNAVNDATTMRDIVRSQPNMMHNVLLQDEAADIRAMLISLIYLSQVAQPGDLVTITYAGHGTTEQEVETHTILSDPDSMEYQNFDEGLPIVRDREYRGWTKSGGKDCLFVFSNSDTLRDDTFSLLLKLFAKDVRVLVICDSCENATMVDSNPLPLPEKNLKRLQTALVATSFYRYSAKNAAMIDNVNRLLTVLNEQAYYNAAILAISAVSSFASAKDFGTHPTTYNNGLFTGALKRVWNGGRFQGNYTHFYNAIASLIMKDIDLFEQSLILNGGMEQFLIDLKKNSLITSFAKFRSSLFPYMHTEHADNVRNFLKQRPFSI
jgi:metacaspase-1